MKRTSYLGCLLFALLISCEQNDEITLAPSISVPDTKSEEIISAKSKSLATNAEKFAVIFSKNFNANTTGAYAKSQWYGDWNSPAWANNSLGYGKIVQESSNKYLSEVFPAGSFGASRGYQWHGRFKAGYNELYLSYRIKFSNGFGSGKIEGKLPGLSGGTSNGGGNLPTGKDGWSARFMFKGTEIKFYMYSCDMYKYYKDKYPVKGKIYYGYGPFLTPGYTLKPNVWYTITQRIVMNTVGKSNGLVEGYINGKLCAVLTGICFRKIESLKIDRIYFANFFGGSGSPPTKTETVSFDDFSVYTYKSNVSVSRGNTPSPAGTSIVLPNL